MCGIFGIFGTPTASFDVCLGLQHLQHRGQDGAGIVSYDKTKGYLKAYHTGLVRESFNTAELAELGGFLSIGHNRYATTGGAGVTMQLQPFFSPCGRIVTAHNGNIVNFHQLADVIQAADAEALPSACDSEVIPWLLGDTLKGLPITPESLLVAAKQLPTKLIGSYAVVGIAEGLGLFALRGPLGLRPLSLGSQLNDEGEPVIAFASESAALQALHYTNIEAVKPGELVVVTEQGEVIRQQFADPNHKHCMFEWVYFSRVESVLDDASVYDVRFSLGEQLALEINKRGLQPDVVVPVPETSRVASVALAEAIGVPCREGLMKNRYSSRTFILESQTARKQAIRNKLFPIQQEVKGKKVLVVDDSIVRGNTAKQIVEMLRQAGAEEIYLASTCPPIISPCYFGIDFPSKDELPARQMSMPELEVALGVDALIYQSLDGLQAALKQKSLCKACLTGEYPLDVSSAERFVQERKDDRAATDAAMSELDREFTYAR